MGLFPRSLADTDPRTLFACFASEAGLVVGLAEYASSLNIDFKSLNLFSKRSPCNLAVDAEQLFLVELFGFEF